MKPARLPPSARKNVVQVYNVEEQPLPYLVMELIEGETLQQKLDRQGPLDVPEILHIGRQIAAGLAAAHAQSLIHRDIKPGNILIEGVGGSALSIEGQRTPPLGGSQPSTLSHKPCVKITDFGLARAADDASLSTSGVIAGTPMYMSPEQAQGRTLDPRSDLFSLGSVLYQMATGRPPFRAANVVAVLKRVVDDIPRPMTETIPELPAWFVAIVNKLLAKHPDERFSTAIELAELFARCESELQLKGQVTSVVIPHSECDADRMRPWFSRLSALSRTKWAMGVIASVVAVSLVWFGLTNSDRLRFRQATNSVGSTSVSSESNPQVESPASTTAMPDDAASPEEEAPLRALTVAWQPLKASGEAARELDPHSTEAAEARWRLHQFARLHSGTSEADAAQTLIQELRWPTDLLRREDISEYELQIAGHGDAAQAPQEIVAIYGDSRMKHWAGARCVATTRDGKTIASGSFDGTIILWDADSGRMKKMLIGHKMPVRAIALSSDDSLLASASDDGVVIVWNTRSGELHSELSRESSSVSTLVFADSGRRLITATDLGLVNLWDLKTAERVKSIQGCQQGAAALALSPTGTMLAIRCPDGSLTLNDPVTLEPLAGGQLPAHSAPIWAIAFDADGQRLASGDNKGQVQLWDINRRQQIRLIDTTLPDVTTLAFDPTGKKLAVGTYKWRVFGYDLESGKVATTTELHHSVIGLVARPHSNHWIAGWGDHWVTLIDRNTGAITNSDPGPLLGFDMSWDGAQVAGTHRESSQLTVWSVSRPNQMRHMKDKASWDSDVAFSTEGRRMISVGGNWVCKLWDPAEGNLLSTFGRHEQWIYAVDFHPDGKRLLTGAADRLVRVTDVLTRQVHHRLAGHSDGVYRVRFSRDGQRFVSVGGDVDGVARIWDTDTGTLQLAIGGGPKPVVSAAFSPDGKTLLTTTISGEAILWSSEDGRLLKVLEGHAGFVNDGDFSPDGRQIATCGHDGTVRFWDAQTGTLRRTLRLHPVQGLIFEVRFTPNGRHLWTRNGNGTLYVLRLAVPDGPNP